MFGRCICKYTYMNEDIHVSEIHTYIYIYMYIYVHICIYVNICIYIYVNICILIHTYTRL